MLDKTDIVPFILDLFAKRGAEEYMGEPVSMAQHMEQAAACAEADGASDELVIASLLHDIGHFVGDFPIDALENGIDNFHENAGAEFLAPYFNKAVTEPIRLHVPAKKYLCAVDKSYYERLSEASKQTLAVQGGFMDEAEIKAFESKPYYQEAVKLRKYDDGGKDGQINSQSIQPVSHYEALMISLLK